MRWAKSAGVMTPEFLRNSNSYKYRGNRRLEDKLYKRNMKRSYDVMNTYIVHRGQRPRVKRGICIGHSSAVLVTDAKYIDIY